MESIHNPSLTGPEITSLWAQYQTDSLLLCINKFLHHHIEDESQQIKAIFKEAIATSENNLSEIQNIYQSIGYPIPKGFTASEDVHLDAPKLFSDGFSLKALHEMTIHGLSSYSIAITVSTRKDIRKFFEDKMNDGLKLYNQTVDLLLSKGIYHRPPYLPTPEGIEFIKTENFFSGLLRDKRALSGAEISNVFFNLKKSIITKAILLGLSQCEQSKQVRNLILRGVQIKHNHIDAFSQVLKDDNLPSPPSWDSDVSDSTVAPFSEKLMLYLTGFLFSTAITYYGAALGTTFRTDLVLKYNHFISENFKYLEDWTDLMVKNQWLEQPPKAVDRNKISEKKN